jgi:hypothetical protein
LSSTFDASLGSDIYYSVDTNTVLSEILRFGYYTSGGATLKELDWTLTLDNDVWNHFALCRSSAMYSLFKNGVLVGVTKTSSGSIMFGNGNMQGRLWVGALVSTDSSTASLGYCYTAGRYNKIDELRITGQVARYTSAFTPPAGPFPDGDSK